MLRKLLSFDGEKRLIDTSTYVGKALARWIKAMGDPYTTELGRRTLIDLVGSNPISKLDCRPAIKDRSIQELYLSSLEDPRSIKDAIDAFDFPTHDGDKVYVPAALQGVLEIDESRRSHAVGKGEVAFALMVRGASFASADRRSTRYDVTVDGVPWHVKDWRTCDATPLGRPSGAQESDDARGVLVDWHTTEIINFTWETICGGIHSDFGSGRFENNQEAEATLLDRYATTDLRAAAMLYQHELDDVLRNSIVMGDAPGAIILKIDEQGPYFERVEKGRMHFYAVSGHDLKFCQDPHHFVSAIMHRIESQVKKQDKEAMQKKKREDAERLQLQNDIDFCRSWNNATSLDTLSRDLGIQIQSLKNRKKSIQERRPNHPDISFEKDLRRDQRRRIQAA